MQQTGRYIYKRLIHLRSLTYTMAAGHKPVVIAPLFQEDDAVVGLAQFGKAMLEKHFQIILERELLANPALHDSIDGLIIMPGIPTTLLKRETQDKMKKLKAVSS